MVEQEKKSIEQGFAPIIGKCPKVLILGTMPSVASLEAQQYYGHPRNAFWWIMSRLCHFQHDIHYEQRAVMLKQHQIAVWDVAHSCYRPGSLDSNIDESTLTPNTIIELLKREPSISAIGFNGQAAHKLFKKYIGFDEVSPAVHILPSTSPANAAMTRENKLSKWLTLKQYLG